MNPVIRDDVERAAEASGFIRLSGLAYVLPLYLIFSYVDYLWYPEYISEFLILRAIAGVFVLIALRYATSPSLKVMEIWLTVYVAFPTWSVHLILFHIGKPAAPYYVGLIMIMVGLAAELGTRWRWYAFNLGQIFIPYLAFGYLAGLGGDAKQFALNLIFMSSVAIISTIGRWFARRLQNQERSLRRRLEFEINERDRVIEQKTREAVDLQAKRARLSEEISRARERMTITEQVAHDIRSPLSALTVTVAHASGLSVEYRSLVRDAVRRIADIADDLLTRARSDRKVIAGKAPPRLDTLLRQIVDEKRLRNHNQVNLTLTMAKPASANIDAADYQRVISNLIDNAIEASGPGVDVRIAQDVVDHEVIVRVTDLGCGIAPELLPLIGRRGLTFGKTDGSGLGLHHAKQFALRAGGDLALTSEVGRGTTVTLKLPVMPTIPGIEPLDLLGIDEIVVLDDDPEIAQTWEQKLGRPVVALTTAGALRNHLILRPATGHTKYLIDLDLCTTGSNGLDLIAELRLAPYAVLVTGRHAAPEVQAAAASLGIRVISKAWIDDLEIQIS